MNMEPFADQEKPESEATNTEQVLTIEDLDAYDFKTLNRGDMRIGVVIREDDAGVIVDVGHKREGFVPAGDLERLDEDARARVTLGAEIPVMVLRPEDREGRPLLSVNQAIMQEDWLHAEEMMKNGKVFEGIVTDHNRGGIVVPFGRIRGFIPASQIVGIPRRLQEDERRKRLAAMVDQTIGLKVIEVDRRRRRLIFSQRRALRAWQEKKREEVMEELREGDVRQGQVTDITGFGAFVDLGGADGLIHVSELSWKRVDNPRDVLKIGDEVEVYVLSVDQDRKRIALSRKKLLPDPWTQVDETYSIGDIVEGRVTRVVDFGAFIELDLGVEGLLHVSEMIGTPELKPADVVRSGQKLPVKIIRIESRRKRLALSARQIRRDEWERWMSQQQMAQEAEAAADEQPAAEVPVAEETAVEQMISRAETAEIAADEQPAAEVPAAEETAVEQMISEADAAEVAADEQPAAEEPVAEETVEPEAGDTDASASAVGTAASEDSAETTEPEEAE